MKYVYLALIICIAALAGITPAPVEASIIAQALPEFASLAVFVPGLLVNRDTLNDINRNLKTLFNKALETTKSPWERVATLVQSTSARNDYKWLGNWPKMREWIGDKVIKALTAHEYSIKNKSFEVTIGVDRDDIEDDELGIYGPQATEAGQSAAEWPEDIVTDLINGAFDTVCYDGQYMIDTDHPVKGASVSNKSTAALSAASQAAAEASLGAARLAMQTIKDEDGRNLKIKPRLLVVPPALEITAGKLANNDKLDDNSPNPYKGTVEGLVWPGLTSDTAWFLLDVSRSLKPFIFQQRQAPKFVSQTDMTADDVFMRKQFKYGAEARGAGGYGFWQLIHGSTGQG